MSQFIQSSISSLPSVTSVSIRTKHNRVQVEVTVDEFDWTNLAPIYQKELELSYTFREQRSRQCSTQHCIMLKPIF